MRILFVAANDWEPWGGSEELWSRAAGVLRSRGHEISISVKWFGRAVPQVEGLRAAGCRIHYRPNVPPSVGVHLHLARLRVLGLARVDYLRGHDLVVVSQGMNLDGLPWMQACRRRGARYAVVAQSASEAWWPYDVHALPLAEAYEAAEMSFFVSQANLELTRRQLATELSTAAVVRNPFNVPYDLRLPWPDPEPDGELRFACVGRLDPRGKGQDLVLDVLHQPRWRERPVHVSFFGTGAAGEGLRRLARMYGLRSVSFAGYSADVGDVWRTHHVLLLPSRYEGLPLAMVEAMLVGRPVVVTDVAGNAEVVTDGETGFLAAAPTAAHLGEAMERAWQERGRLRQMGEEAAAAIRRLVPPDPAADFADRIGSIVRG